VRTRVDLVSDSGHVLDGAGNALLGARDRHARHDQLVVDPHPLGFRLLRYEVWGVSEREIVCVCV